MRGFGGMEVWDAEEIAEVCSALAHPNRIFLYRILQEQGGAFLADLVDMASEALPKPVKYMTVKHHVHRLRDAGIVSIGKEDGRFYVTVERPNLRLIEAPAEALEELETSIEVRR